jgi:prevent-host-death family protein
MPNSVLTITDVNQNFSLAKAAAEKGDVVITQRGKPSFVLMTYDSYQKRQKPESALALFERLHLPGIEDIELELPKREIEPFPRPNQGLDWLDG